METAPTVPKVFIGNKIDLRDLTIEGKNAHVRKEAVINFLYKKRPNLFVKIQDVHILNVLLKLRQV